MSVPSRVADRLSAGLKRFQPVLTAAKARDVNESDTSLIVTDLMADIFGYDKYAEITRELCIRGTFCDLATRIDNKFQMIVEVKAIGLELKDAHVKQAVDYAANQGIEWVALTNGHLWKVYRVIFGKPIDATLVLDFDMLAMSHKSETDVAALYLVTRESMVKSGLYAYHDQKEATNKYYLAALILGDPVLETLRRELRRLSGAKLQVEELRDLLMQDVVKRDLLDGDKAETAKKKVHRASSRALRARRDDETPEDEPEQAAEEPAAEPPATE